MLKSNPKTEYLNKPASADLGVASGDLKNATAGAASPTQTSSMRYLSVWATPRHLLLFLTLLLTFVFLTPTPAHAATTTISGTLFTADRTTPITTPETITLALFATTTLATFSTTTESGTGNFTFTIDLGQSIATGTPLTVFLDNNNATLNAVTITKTSGTTTVSGLSLFTNHLVLRNEGTGTTTQASDLTRFDNTNDSDLNFTASTTLDRLTVLGTTTLLVASGTTFHLNLSLTAHSLEIATTATAWASSTLTLTGNYTNNGNFSASDPTWISRSAAGNDDSWSAITHANGLFVAVGGGPDRVMTSPDGVTWTPQIVPEANAWSSVVFGNGLFVAVACGINATTCNTTAGGNRVMTSPDGSTWTARPAAAANQWTSITFGNGLFVAVADGGTNRVMTSPDGITWTTRTPPGNPWRSVTFGNGLFVAVAEGGHNRVMTSPDGITWTGRAASVDDSWQSVIFGNNLFVAVSAGGRLMTSPNGINWTSRSLPPEPIMLQSVTFGNGLFVAVACGINAAGWSCANDVGGSHIIASVDGITWTSRSVPEGNQWRAITYGNGLFVAVSDSGVNRVMTSPESLPLTLAGTITQTLAGGMTGANTLPVVITTGSGTKTFLNNASTTDLIVATSSGAVTLPTNFTLTGSYLNNATVTAPTNFFFTGIHQIATGSWNGTPNLTLGGSGRKTFVNNATTSNIVVANGVEFIPPTNLTITGSYTNNGTSTSVGGLWNSVLMPTMTFFSDITYGNGMFVMVSIAGSHLARTSPDGITWTGQSVPETNSWSDIAYGNGLFVAVSSNGTNRVMTSPDGITWTARAASEANAWSSIVFGNGLFVAVSSDGTNRVMTSPDGITWTARAASEANAWSEITFGNNLFVAVATNGTNRVMTSPDGITWTPRAAANVNEWTAITYGNGLFVAVGQSGVNRVMTSPDGITWTPHPAPSATWMQSIAYGSGLFVAVAEGGNNRVMTSPDGSTWTTTIAPISNWTNITYANGRFVAVGRHSNISMIHIVGTTTFSGTTTQNISGSLTGASAFGHVTFSGAGTKTFLSNSSTSDFTIASSSGAVTAPPALTIFGSYTNQATFTAGTGTVFLAGTDNQTIAGTLTGPSAFNNLILTNNTATTTFNNALAVTNTLRADPGTTLTLASGATTTITHLNLTGTTSRPITLNSTASGTRANLVVASSSQVSFTTIRDSNACGSTGGRIDVTTSFGMTDGGNNQCWRFIAATGTPSIALDRSYAFFVGQATTTLGPITIVEASEDPGITTALDIRLSIATTTTDFRFDGTVGALVFGGSAAGKVAGTVTYADGGATVVIDVTSNFAASDTLTIEGLAVGGFTGIAATTSRLALHTTGTSTGTPATSTSETFRIVGSAVLSEHSNGQATNQFSFRNEDEATLYAFRLTPNGENATVTDLVLTLSGVQKMDTTNLINLALYRDNNSNGVRDGGDSLLSGGGIMTLNGQHGAITFSADWLAEGAANYLVVGDTRALASGVMMTFSLPANGVTATGVISEWQPQILGAVTKIQHLRNLSGGSGRVGDAAPAGRSVEAGGGAGGGVNVGQEPDGENIASDPDFRRPTDTGIPNNEWTNGTNALASDGVYATAASVNLRQTYHNFGFAIPSGNSIQGIVVKLDASGAPAGGTIDVGLSWDNGASYTTAKATPTLLGTDVVYTVGGIADGWGRSWNAAEFNDGTFLLRVTAQPSGGNTLRLDALEIRVHHQAVGGGAGGGGRI